MIYVLESIQFKKLYFNEVVPLQDVLALQYHVSRKLSSHPLLSQCRAIKASSTFGTGHC
jgi:hypothetical protein